MTAENITVSFLHTAPSFQRNRWWALDLNSFNNQNCRRLEKALFHTGYIHRMLAGQFV